MFHINFKKRKDLSRWQEHAEEDFHPKVTNEINDVKPADLYQNRARILPKFYDSFSIQDGEMDNLLGWLILLRFLA